MRIRMQLSVFFFVVSATFISCGEKENPNTKPVREENIDSLLTLYPDSVALLIKRGNQLFLKNEFEAALADAAKAFRLDSLNLDTRLLYAKTLNNKPGRIVAEIALAQRHFQLVLKKDPKNLEALIGIASTFSQQQDFENSFKYINQALRIDPKYRDAYVLKGSNYRMLGNIELTKSSYETAVQQDPEFFEAYIMLGSLYEAEGNKLCLQYYTTALQLRPDNMDAIYALAYAKEGFGILEEAKSLYREMAADTVDYYVERGLFHQGYIKQFSEKDIDSALYFYNSALATNPKYVEAWHNLGLCYIEKGDKSRALQAFSKALKYNPDFTISREMADKIR